MFLGFFISFLLIMSSQGEQEVLNPILTIWCVTLPVFDLISVVLRRLMKKLILLDLIERIFTTFALMQDLVS